MQQRYVDALCHEMALRRNSLPAQDSEIKTIYFGGGTPSLLTEAQLCQIFSHIQKNFFNGNPIPDDVEITLECNPDDVNSTFCDAIHRLPINRISMGAQSFSETRLQFIGRRHHASDIERAVNELRSSGVQNLSLDLIFGFPEQSISDWESDVRAMIALHPEHISAYNLSIEEGTKLWRMREENLIHDCDDETCREMYRRACVLLREAGYSHYEISNFALPNRQSRHNSAYWNETPYIGLGAAAHSYDRKTRSWNPQNLQNYIENIENDVLPLQSEKINEATRYNDLITTALRTAKGIDLNHLKEPFKSYILQNAAPHLERGTMQIENHCLRIAETSWFVSDDIMSDLIYV